MKGFGFVTLGISVAAVPLIALSLMEPTSKEQLCLGATLGLICSLFAIASAFGNILYKPKQ